MKSKGTAYLLWFFLGIFGAHKFYLGKVGMGILYLFTAGLFFIGWFIDLFTLGSQVDLCNALLQGGGQQQAQQQSQQQNIVVNVQGGGGSTEETQTKKSAEKQILELPDDEPLSVKQLMKMTSLELHETETAIKKLVEKGMAKEVVDESGSIKYDLA